MASPVTRSSRIRSKRLSNGPRIAPVIPVLMNTYRLYPEEFLKENGAEIKITLEEFNDRSAALEQLLAP